MICGNITNLFKTKQAQILRISLLLPYIPSHPLKSQRVKGHFKGEGRDAALHKRNDCLNALFSELVKKKKKCVNVFCKGKYKALPLLKEWSVVNISASRCFSPQTQTKPSCQSFS